MKNAGGFRDASARDERGWGIAAIRNSGDESGMGMADIRREQLSIAGKIALMEELWSELSREEPGTGDYFIGSISSDIGSLRLHAGIHRRRGEHFRLSSKRFPQWIYYRMEGGNASAASYSSASVVSQSMQLSVMDWPRTRRSRGWGKSWLPATRLLSSMAPAMERSPAAR